MSDNYGLVKWNTLHNIGEAIRNKTGSSDLFYPSEMANAINNISGGGIKEPAITSLFPYLDRSSYSYSLMNNLFNVKKFYFTNYIPEGVNIIAEEKADGLFPSNIAIYEGYPLEIMVENGNFLGMCMNDIENNVYLNNVNVYNIYTSTPEYITPKLNDVTATTIGGPPYYYRWTEENQWENLGLNITDTKGYPIERNNNLYYNNGYYCYGFGYDSSFNNNEFSIMDMSNIFSSGALYNYLGDAFCGNYTKYMVNTYSSCSGKNIKTAVCGPNVISMRNAYCQCYNLVGSAACSDSVIDMYNAYYYCNNLTTAVIGNNVQNLANAYYGCSNLTGDIVLPSSVKDISYAFYYCGNLNSISGDTSNVERLYGVIVDDYNSNNVYIDWDNFKWDSLKDVGYSFYSGNPLLTSVNGFPSLVNAPSFLYNCTNLVNVNLQTKSLSNISYTFYNCVNLSQESYNNIINSIDNSNFKDGNYAFYNCSQIHDVYIKRCFSSGTTYDMYLNVPIENVYWDENIYSFGTVLANTSISQAYCPDSIGSAVYMYSNCYNLTNAVCGNNVINMFGMYSNCFNLVGDAACGPSVRDISYAYSECHNLTNAVCGNNVINMINTYRNCYNLTNAACSDNVINMSYAYDNCFNLTTAICGSSVQDMSHAYTNCYNLTTAVCGNNVINMASAYRNCDNLIHFVIGPNVTNLSYTYYNCHNLIDDIEMNVEKVNNFSGCLYDCKNVKNILLMGNNLTWHWQNNAFGLSEYGNTNRNIVILNINLFNNILDSSANYNICGGRNFMNRLHNNIAILNPPVNVTVNGIEYEMKRVACIDSTWDVRFPTYYNVYCAE